MHRTGHRATRSRLMLGVTAGAVASVWLVAAPPGNAQGQKTETEVPAPQHQPPSSTIPDQKLDAAAAAIEHVTLIKQTYQQRLAVAPPSDQDRIAGEATTVLKKAITDEGLSVDEYNSIIKAALNDPSVREQLVQRIHHTGDEKGGEE